MSIMDFLPENFFNLMYTDPPQYRLINDNIKFNNRTDMIRKVSFDLFENYEDFLYFTEDWLMLSSSKMKLNSSICVWFAEDFIQDLKKLCKKYGFEYKDTIYWHKINPTPRVRKTGFLSSVETLVWFARGKPTFNFFKQDEMHDFIETSICMGNERLKNKNNKTLHPTQKPIKVVKKHIKIFSNEGEYVFDPFSGTGTTNVVCKMLNRNCFGTEKELKYYIASVKRLFKTKVSININKILESYLKGEK